MLAKRMIVVLFAVMSLYVSASAVQGAFLPELTIKDVTEADHFSNNLWSLHDRLQEKLGLSFEIVYLQDMFWNTRGGINTKDSGEYPRLLGLHLELDTAKAGLWENGAFFLSLEHYSGKSPSNHAGDWQMLDNIDSDRMNQVSEFWYRHAFLDNKLWLKLGKMEANADFSYIETGIEFINSSAGLIPTVPIPSYPDQDWGAVLGVDPADWFGWKAGIYQAEIDGSRSVGHTIDQLRGPMLIVEPSFKYKLGELPGMLSIGSWWNGRDFEAYHRYKTRHETHGKAWGFYGFWEQQLWKENPGAQDCKQGIGLFAQYGWAPKDRFEVEDYAGGGLRWQGAIPGRDDDVLGLGAFNVYFSDRAELKNHSETAVELFYKGQLTGWLAVQPDLQYITNPGGDIDKNALVLGCRAEFVF
ncbi:MAG: carbohydrate porin [Deltaproteobacteria bacterium]|nr:carbohydrate porin [Deltaproteobacteria bacterium]